MVGISGRSWYLWSGYKDSAAEEPSDRHNSPDCVSSLLFCTTRLAEACLTSVRCRVPDAETDVGT